MQGQLASQADLWYNARTINMLAPALLVTTWSLSRYWIGVPTMDNSVIPPGLCQCGCGQPTQIANQSRTARGWIKGQYKRYARHHSPRIRPRVLGDVRLCSGCKKEHPLSHFKKDKRSADGYSSWCRDCNNQCKRQWYQAHAETERKNSAQWKRENPEKLHAQLQIRYGRRRGAPGYATSEQVLARIAFYGGCCAYCGGAYEHLDHVIPISRGGSNWPANLRPACEKCNTQKNDKTLLEWRGMTKP